MPLLETRALTRRFGGLTAVDAVSMQVNEGAIVGVIGPNGAGKSTLVNLVTGHLKPTSGRVLIGGDDVTGAKPWRVAGAGVARTFQIVKPFRGMTVRENVAVGAMYSRGRSTVAGSLKVADEVIERVGLDAQRDVCPTDLSVASNKRLELAKALAMRPRLLLLDEVMAGLRPAEVTEAVELIRSLRDLDGITILVIEHVMRAIVAISDEVVVLHKGSLLAQGQPDDVMADSRVVEAYLGKRYAERQANAEPQTIDLRDAPPTPTSATPSGNGAGPPAPTKEQPLLDVTGVRAGYGEVCVLWDVDLSIAAGEIVALVGSNGAGKTTLLRTVSGILTPEVGRVRWNGNDIAGWPAERIVRAGLAHVPEGRRLFAGLTVRQNLLMGAFHRRDAGAIDTDLDRVLTLFPRLRERIEQVAGHLSGGEQQMCSIARGLMSRPQLLMIDELSLGLAPNVVDLLLERLQAVADAGTALLLVEQDVATALDVAARAYVLDSGRVALEGASPVLADDQRVREAYLGVA